MFFGDEKRECAESRERESTEERERERASRVDMGYGQGKRAVEGLSS